MRGLIVVMMLVLGSTALTTQAQELPDLEAIERELEQKAAEQAAAEKAKQQKAREAAAKAEAKRRAEAKRQAEAEAEATRQAEAAERKREAARRAEEEARSRPLHFLSEAGGGVLLQPASGLKWTQSDNGKNVGWDAARAYCTARGDGWRLPTKAELLSLMGGEGTPCRDFTCKVSPLLRLTNLFFWSSETEGSSKARVVNLQVGRWDLNSRSSTNSNRALCVRPPEHDSSAF